jgi:hypothetical protein
MGAVPTPTAVREMMRLLPPLSVTSDDTQHKLVVTPVAPRSRFDNDAWRASPRDLLATMRPAVAASAAQHARSRRRLPAGPQRPATAVATGRTLSAVPSRAALLTALPGPEAAPNALNNFVNTNYPMGLAGPLPAALRTRVHCAVGHPREGLMFLEPVFCAHLGETSEAAIAELLLEKYRAEVREAAAPPEPVEPELATRTAEDFIGAFPYAALRDLHRLTEERMSALTAIVTSALAGEELPRARARDPDRAGYAQCAAPSCSRSWLHTSSSPRCAAACHRTPPRWPRRSG